MNKKLQKEILDIIKLHNTNPQTGERWIGMEEKVFTVLEKEYQPAEIRHNLSLLLDSGKINMNFKDQFGTTLTGSARLTMLGYQEFDPWYKKLWIFFKDDFAKILSIIATILSIIAIVVSLVTNSKA